MEMKPLSRNLALKAMKYNGNEAFEPQPCSKSIEYNENEAFEPQPCCGSVARQSINKSRPTKPTQNRNLALKAWNTMKMKPLNRNLALRAMKYNGNEAFEPQPCSKSNEIQWKWSIWTATLL